MKHLFLLITILFLTDFLFAHDTTLVSQNAWKKIIKLEKFKVTKNKRKIPATVLTQIGVDTISEITRYAFKWDGSCAGREPRMKLNWAATNNQSWIICYTTGGYSVKTHYAFISINPSLSQAFSIGFRKYLKYSEFKAKFITNKIFDLGTVRALY